ncbi:hypothetical protein [Sodalis-like endosymbiont of Proechinophthirus fluctus]|uniref:hypothetical protein n=1 Tax=Sodalis-like endosymbiont of Proechinophthirus fluctus TaxID=1462730 RepID=UPI000A75E650
MVTHSQFIVQHINTMTTLVRDHYILIDRLSDDYLFSCEVGAAKLSATAEI